MKIIIEYIVTIHRYTALSFRNSEELTNSNWNMRSRVAPLRNRRETHEKRNIVLEPSSSTVDDTSNTAVVPTQQLSDAATSADNADGMQRTRRDTPGCVVNYESNRQLLVGCVQTNVIEVKPHCSDDGDEGNFPFDQLKSGWRSRLVRIPGDLMSSRFKRVLFIIMCICIVS